jgi:peptidoglycan/LPS O-acetylase OafA/YrhL
MSNVINRRIPPGFSLYLDLVRFTAAVMVVLYHSWAEIFPGMPFKWPGHEAVVVFFVLSGYVISHAAKAPGTTLSTYVIHRFARIVPVAYGALLLALCICLWQPGLNKDGDTWLRTLMNMFFLAQSGLLAMEAPLNPPFWSLNYEVWYYAIFGVWMFSARKWRVVFTAMAAVLAGPKILALFPVWLMGVLLYKHMPRLKPALAWLIALVTFVLGAMMTWYDVSDVLRSWLYSTVPAAWRLHYSTQFLYDILLGIVVSAHFTAIASLENLSLRLEKIAPALRYLAGCTFTLYVFHGPLIVVIRDMLGWTAPFAFYGLMAVAVLIAAELTERRVKWYRTLTIVAMSRLRRVRTPVTGPAGS